MEKASLPAWLVFQTKLVQLAGHSGRPFHGDKRCHATTFPCYRQAGDSVESVGEFRRASNLSDMGVVLPAPIEPERATKRAAEPSNSGMQL